jgi:phosphatidylglycerophosphate synthase
LVTKFFWPRPAKHVVRWCANLGITPNAVTITGLLLMLLAGVMFAEGYYLIGLVPGWIMTFLDTVDGKLARVTVQSSRFGHVLDHGMDILHPPFWYVLWGMGLAGETLLLPRADYYGIIFIAYIVGRLCEAQFHALGSCSIFGWRPFDAYFRLITARRNTCMILLTLFVALGRPDWAFLAVVFWTVFTTAVLVGRLAYGAFVRATSGPLKSWLADPETAARENARAYRLFSVTRGAYAEG